MSIFGCQIFCFYRPHNTGFLTQIHQMAARTEETWCCSRNLLAKAAKKVVCESQLDSASCTTGKWTSVSADFKVSAPEGVPNKAEFQWRWLYELSVCSISCSDLNLELRIATTISEMFLSMFLWRLSVSLVESWHLARGTENLWNSHGRCYNSNLT